MTPDTLLIIGGTMALMLAVTSFVLTQKNAWKAILLKVTLFGGLNIGFFIWSELLGGWGGYRLFLFWLAALLPPLIGIAIGSLVGALVNWRISKVRPTYKSPRAKATAARKKKKPKEKQQKPAPKPRIID